VWLVAKKRPSWIPINNFKISPGHAFIGIVAKGSKDNKFKPIKTFGFWPDTNLTTDNADDKNNLQKLLNGESISDRGYAVRKSRISDSRANWIMNTSYTEAGCSNYKVVGGVNTECNCMDYATRLWHVLTARQEDFRMRPAPNFNLITGIGGSIISGVIYDYWPDSLAESMNKHTQKTGTEFVDTGNRWN
jgi:hypothetical protein